MYDIKRVALARQISDFIHEKEVSLVMDKVHADEERLRNMSDREFAVVLRQYGRNLIKRANELDNEEGK
jgi:hypothetical protein